MLIFLFVTATLKDVKHKEVLLREREIQLAKKSVQYQWEMFPDVGLPSAIDASVRDLPMDEQFGRVKNVDFTKSGLKGVGGALGAGVTVVDDIKSLEDYYTLNQLIGEPQLLHVMRAGRWTSDVEFGRQILNGVNPAVICKCTQLPPKFPVTDEMIRPFLCRGLTLDQEIEVNYDELANASNYQFTGAVRPPLVEVFIL